jgi:two-component sensor histidine kinase
MGPAKQQAHPLMVEVSHQVNSPLAAIRNAIYLAAQRTADPEIIQYLQIADDEVSSIVNRIRELRAEVETWPATEPAARAAAATPVRSAV